MLVAVAVAVSSGCSSHDGERKPAGRHTSSKTAQAQPEPKVTPKPEPRTAAQFVARAREAMGAEKGWTFALRGSESAVMQGQAPSGATYAATVHRTTAPVALRQTGTVTTSKGEREPEVVYVVGGTGYVKKGAEGWKKGALSEPGIANDVEDPLAELDAFAAYAKSATVSRTGAGVRLRVRASGWQLSAARDRPALKRAVREVEPVLGQLRKAGVTATDGHITLRSFAETWDLGDGAQGYRVVAHRYAFTFLVPFQGGDITVSQEVRADNRGVFDGNVALPSGVK
ncbi:hypothetical protein [Streptomyces diastatochromogenes]|uniref:Lipoprotein n=1 Tax=Streptomyces diastatochromogenes TaxID=42236 RepID=A0A233SS00_STRDA|nr:hypothetical protein [Streptomyces diastatochromogenes]OXY98425.1 hypothetical protein BEK98_06095 [Streptomyces diastatochromogenes]